MTTGVTVRISIRLRLTRGAGGSDASCTCIGNATCGRGRTRLSKRCSVGPRVCIGISNCGSNCGATAMRNGIVLRYRNGVRGEV